MKENNEFVRSRTYEDVIEIPSTNDIVYVLSKLIDELNDKKESSKSVTAEHLNKFNQVLTLYYESRGYEYYYVEMKPFNVIKDSNDFLDPISLPSETVSGNPELFFEEVKVYGFPSYRDNYKISSDFTNSPFLQSYEVFIYKLHRYFKTNDCDYSRI